MAKVLNPDDLLSTMEVADALSLNRSTVHRWKSRFPSIGMMVGTRFKIPRAHLDLLKSGMSPEQVAAAPLFDFGVQHQAQPDLPVGDDGVLEYVLLEEPAPEAATVPEPLPDAAPVVANSGTSAPVMPPDPDAPFSNVDIPAFCDRAAIAWSICHNAISPRTFDLVADLLVDLLVQLKLVSPHAPDAAMQRYAEARNIRRRAMQVMVRHLES